MPPCAQVAQSFEVEIMARIEGDYQSCSCPEEARDRGVHILPWKCSMDEVQQRMQKYKEKHQELHVSLEKALVYSIGCVEGPSEGPWDLKYSKFLDRALRVIRDINIAEWSVPVDDESRSYLQDHLPYAPTQATCLPDHPAQKQLQLIDSATDSPIQQSLATQHDASNQLEIPPSLSKRSPIVQERQAPRPQQLAFLSNQHAQQFQSRQRSSVLNQQNMPAQHCQPMVNNSAPANAYYEAMSFNQKHNRARTPQVHTPYVTSQTMSHQQHYVPLQQYQPFYGQGPNPAGLGMTMSNEQFAMADDFFILANQFPPQMGAAPLDLGIDSNFKQFGNGMHESMNVSPNMSMPNLNMKSLSVNSNMAINPNFPQFSIGPHCIHFSTPSMTPRTSITCPNTASNIDPTFITSQSPLSSRKSRKRSASTDFEIPSRHVRHQQTHNAHDNQIQHETIRGATPIMQANPMPREQLPACVTFSTGKRVSVAGAIDMGNGKIRMQSGNVVDAMHLTQILGKEERHTIKVMK